MESSPSGGSLDGGALLFEGIAHYFPEPDQLRIYIHSCMGEQPRFFAVDSSTGQAIASFANGKPASSLLNAANSELKFPGELPLRVLKYSPMIVTPKLRVEYEEYLHGQTPKSKEEDKIVPIRRGLDVHLGEGGEEVMDVVNIDEDCSKERGDDMQESVQKEGEESERGKEKEKEKEGDGSGELTVAGVVPSDDVIFWMDNEAGVSDGYESMSGSGGEDNGAAESDGDDEEGGQKEGRPAKRKRSRHNRPPSIRLDFENAVLMVHGKGALFNFRDLGYFPASILENSMRHVLTTTTGKVVKSGILYRSACWTRTPDMTDSILKEACSFLQAIGIRTIVDMRATQEKLEDPLDDIVEEYYPMADDKKEQTHRRYALDLLNSRLKYRGLLMNTPANVYMQLAASVLRTSTASSWNSKRWSSARPSAPGSQESPEEIPMEGDQPESLTKIFAQGVFNPLGLNGFTKLFVLYSGKEIGDILRLCLDKSKHPILLHCTSGKDRTGLLAALILYICGVSKDDIIDSYHLSEVYLMPIFDQMQKENRAMGLDENFDVSPKWVMRDVLDYIDQKWGSVEVYLSTVCGFGSKEQQQLRELFLIELKK